MRFAYHLAASVFSALAATPSAEAADDELRQKSISYFEKAFKCGTVAHKTVREGGAYKHMVHSGMHTFEYYGDPDTLVLHTLMYVISHNRSTNKKGNLSYRSPAKVKYNELSENVSVKGDTVKLTCKSNEGCVKIWPRIWGYPFQTNEYITKANETWYIASQSKGLEFRMCSGESAQELAQVLEAVIRAAPPSE